MDIWQIAYHLCGITLLGKTEQERLGTLPMPVRTAIVKTVSELASNSVTIDWPSPKFGEISPPHPWYDTWQITDESVKDILNSAKTQQVLPSVRFSSPEAFFRSHRLYNLQQDGSDEHYAERRFVQEVFVPVLGLDALSSLRPQEKFCVRDGVERRIDFVLKGIQKYALEVEGWSYHGQREQYDGDKQRQRELTEAGYAYYPFSYTDIVSGKARIALEGLTANDQQLQDKRLNVAPDSAQAINPMLYLLLNSFPERYQSYQKLALWQLWQAVSTGKEVLRLAELNFCLPIFAIALCDVLSVLEQAAILYGLPLSLPTIEFFQIGKQSVCYDLLWQKYRECVSVVTKDEASHPVQFHLIVLADEERLSDILPNLSLDYCGLDYLTDVDSGTAQPFDAIQSQIKLLLRHVTLDRTHDVTFSRCDEAAINFFARRYFRLFKLKKEQQQLVERALRGESGLGILPTGFGKSLIFQLYALLTPYVTLVISPLRSLMHDQIYGLHELGLTCAEAITANDSAAEKSRKLKETFGNHIRLLYIAPERLQIKSFVDELNAGIKNSPIRTLAVDEAHCVSEWGHDFRPSYLQIDRLRKRLEETLQRKLMVIALTATASKQVREDIEQVLGLEVKNTIQLASTDRKNLSLSVHQAEQTLTTKHDVMKDLIQKTIPLALKIDLDDLIPSDTNLKSAHCGLVFATYAKANGKTNYDESVHPIADYLREEVTFEPKAVQVYASSSAKLCPACQSPLLRTKTDYKTKKKLFICQNRDCRQSFPIEKSQNAKNWEKEILKVQDDFKRSAFPLLVATKGYGMGVDKRNIRYVIHHAMSGGIESYVQEAGRAGRDGKHAHVALIYRPPTEGCYQEFLNKEQVPSCATGPMKCKFGLQGLCDLGHQMRFFASSFPGLKSDREIALDTYETILKTPRFSVKNTKEEQNLEARTELAIYRLQKLGVVADYTVEYKAISNNGDSGSEFNLNPEFNVQRQDWTEESVSHHLYNFLLSTRFALSQAQAKLQELQEWAGNDSQKLLKGALTILLRRFYETVKPMRYQMLMSLLRYADINPRDTQKQLCRRVPLLARLDGLLFGDDVRCGFCDVCQPNYHFSGANGSQIDEWVTQQQKILQTQLAEALQGFDPSLLRDLTQSIIGLRMVHAVLARLEQILENDSLNLAALYLSGVLYAYHAEFTQSMIRLERTWHEGIIQGLPDAGLRLIYEAARQVQSEKAFQWIIQQHGPFDTPEGLNFLINEAGQIYGTNSQEYHRLCQLRMTRSLKKLQSTLTELKPSLEQLQTAFNQPR